MADSDKIKRKNKWVRVSLRSLGIAVAVLLLLPGLLYIPAVQRAVKNLVEEKVSEATGYDIQVGRFLLKFPLDVSVDDVLVLDEHRDTLVSGKHIRVDVALLPLVGGDVVVRRIEADGASYRMMSQDSSMLLVARVERFRVGRSKVELVANRVDMSSAELQGADVLVSMDVRKAVPEKPDTATANAVWLFGLNELELKDIRYRMSMMPTIDSLDTRIARGQMDKVSVNLATNLVKVGGLEVDSLRADYYRPDKIAEENFLNTSDLLEKTESVDTLLPEKPWTIIADRLRIRTSEALYAVRGVEPSDGLDMNYLHIGNIGVAIDGFYNRGSKIRVPIRNITADERCGVGIRNVSGVFEMNDSVLSIDALKLQTLLSEVSLDAKIEQSLFGNDPEAAVDIDFRSSLSLEEAGKVMPSIRPVLRSVSRFDNAFAEIRMSGTGRSLEVKKAGVKIPGIAEVAVEGDVQDLTDAGRTSGSLILSGALTGGSYLERSMKLDSALRIPVVRLQGQVDYQNARLNAGLTASVDTGKILLKGKWNMDSRHYGGNLTLKGFDVRTVMPYGGIGVIAGNVAVKGKGYDLYRMSAEVDVSVNRIDYGAVSYRNLGVSASIENGDYRSRIVSDNDFAELSFAFDGHIAPDRYRAKLDGRISSLDLQRMGFSEDPLSGRMELRAFVDCDLSENRYAGVARLAELDLEFPKNAFRTDSLDIGFFSDSVRSNFRLRNNDLLMSFKSGSGVFALSDSLGRVAVSVDSMLAVQRLDVCEIMRLLPAFKMNFTSGKDNVAYQYLLNTGISTGNISMNLEKGEDLQLQATVNGLTAGGVVVDTICLKGQSRADSLLYGLHVGNTEKNAALFKWADLRGTLGGNRLNLALKQMDRAGVVGFDVGAGLTVADSVVRMALYPENPVIAFKNWTMNAQNFISLDLRDAAVQADMEARSGNNSHIKIYTDAVRPEYNGVNVDLAGIALQEWLTLSPFSPPVEGVLSSKLKLYYADKYVWGDGNVDVDEFRYGKRRVGDIALSSKMAYVGNSKKIMAQASMFVDGRKVLGIRGYRNDSLPESEYDLNLTIDKYPLQSVNAFLPASAGNLSGYLNGGLKVAGKLEDPEIEGYVRFDSTRIKMPAFGAEFVFDTVPIPVDGGIVKFNRFDLFGTNSNPITIDGQFNLLPMSQMHADLYLKGRNVQVVSGKKTGKSELYGKGFMDLDVSVFGNLNELDVNASVGILAGTNLTYVLQSGTSAIAESSGGDVVTFVQLNDTTAVEKTDSVAERPFGMRVNAVLTVQPNAIFTVNLSPDGKNRIQIDGDGMLNYSQSYQGDMRLIGRYVINNGYVRYTPPMLSEKLFNFKEGSSIVWNGELLNPALNVKAVQTVKANVTGENQDSRIIPFDVSLNVGNTMQALDVSFDLSADGDVTIANELSGMTAEQRSTQAMNLLLYNTYTGASTKADSNLSGNMLNSFLASSLNKWAASNISGVDLSFGINQYDRTVGGATSTTTSYSYQVSKSVFNDRFKIAVGGNYSTDASAEDNLSQNLVNDISFEYKLNKTGTAYVKLFRHTEYESILEGEITETGGGFVWKRKISSWKDFFRFVRILKRPKKKEADMQRNENANSANGDVEHSKKEK